MLVKNETYLKYVIEDLKNYDGLLQPVKTHFYLRIKPRYVDPKKLHPNPADEFSMESVGPNWEIVGNYEKDILQRKKHGDDIFEEPLTGVKLKKGGYLLLNGHHRWLAALTLRIEEVPLEVVNITTEDDVYKVVNKSQRDKCISIDLDEVLLVDEKPKFPFSLFFKENIRTNVDLLIEEVQHLGFDVWVYTGSYKSEAYIRWLFKINGCKVDGVVNGVAGKGGSKKLAEIFRSKYKNIIHVDNEMITSVDTVTKNYNIAEITVDNDGWASAVAREIKNEHPVR